MDKMRGMLRAVGLTAMLFAPASGAAAESYLDAEEKARQAHETALSDVIYEQENFKALYYQNLQIIDLLKEIRDEIHSLNLREAKDD
jgi:hypothetical protein